MKGSAMPICKSCDQDYPHSAFKLLPSGKVRKKCRVCEAEAQREYQRKYDSKKRAEKKDAPLAKRVEALEEINADLQRRLQLLESALTNTTVT